MGSAYNNTVDQTLGGFGLSHSSGAIPQSKIKVTGPRCAK